MRLPLLCGVFSVNRFRGGGSGQSRGRLGCVNGGEEGGGYLVSLGFVFGEIKKRKREESLLRKRKVVS